MRLGPIPKFRITKFGLGKLRPESKKPRQHFDHFVANFVLSLAMK